MKILSLVSVPRNTTIHPSWIKKVKKKLFKMQSFKAHLSGLLLITILSVLIFIFLISPQELIVRDTNN